MSRYFTRPVMRRPRADWLDDERPLLPSIDVPEHEPCDTGLVDMRGDPIFRGPNGMGFHNPRERA